MASGHHTEQCGKYQAYGCQTLYSPTEKCHPLEITSFTESSIYNFQETISHCKDYQKNQKNKY